LLDDVNERVSSEGLQPDFVVVSGDIAFQSAPKEYDLARQFFDELLTVTRLSKERLFIVPGNHDVDRNSISPGASAIASSLQSRDAINGVLTAAEDRRLIFLKFKHYAAFANDCFEGHLSFDDERYFYVQHFDQSDKRLAVLCLNSAWLSTGDHDRGRLALGERQVRQALGAARDADVRIALLHHPFDWLQEFDRNDCEALLMQECDFVLHGHLHRTGLLSLSTPDAGAMTIAAGACYESRQFPNAYNFVQLDYETGQGAVHLRTYSDQRGGFWTKDVLTYRNVDNGQYTFNLPPGLGTLQAEVRRKAPVVHVAPDVDPALLQDSYLRRVIVSCNALPLHVIDPRAVERTRQQTMKLLAVYVPLDTTTPIGVIKEVDRAKRIRLYAEWTSEPDLEVRPVAALESVVQKRRMVLLGSPGSGKSTFVNHLALCMAGESLYGDGKWLARLEPAWPHGPLLPMRVTLREFGASEHCDGTGGGLWGFIADTLASKNLAGFAPHLRKRLLEGRVMVILDGLDEVSGTAERKAIRDAVADFAATYNDPTNRYLVTCRGYAYQDPALQLGGFTEYTLAPFKEKQIDAFIKCWYEEVCRLGWKNRAEAQDLTRRLQVAARLPDLIPLARNPLQLTMMASLHFSWGRLPEDRAELYQEMVRLLLVRWQEARLGQDAGVTQMVRAGNLESALERVAFVAHLSQKKPEGPADVSEAQLRSVLKNCVEGSWDAAGELLTFVKERAGLLVEKEPGVYTFPHLSYQEYLAGCYLAVQPDFPDEVNSLARENYEQWREVALWAVGIMARLKKMTHVAVDVAAALCPSEVTTENVSEHDWRASRLAGEALLEIGLKEVKTRARHEQVLTRVQAWLVALVERSAQNPRERAAGGNILGRLGDPRFLPHAWYLPDEPLLGFVEIPGGSFLMGSDQERDPKASELEMPQHQVTLPRYYMARYPVTVAQFRAFAVDVCAYEPKNPYEPTDPDGLKGLGNHPVSYVSWHDSLAYCRWLTEKLRAWKGTPEPLATLLREGKDGEAAWRITLPSEAEWEKAARGTDNRIYPWGDEPNPNRANYGKTGIGSTSAVGCSPGGASPYGCLDMAGNVWEWTRTLDHAYPYTTDDDSEGLEPGKDKLRVLRGGAFDGTAWSVRSAFRGANFPAGRVNLIGFRVVLSPSSSGL